MRCTVLIIITGVSKKHLLPSACRQRPLILLELVGWTHDKALTSEQIRVMVSGLLGARSRGNKLSIVLSFVFGWRCYEDILITLGGTCFGERFQVNFADGCLRRMQGNVACWVTRLS